MFHKTDVYKRQAPSSVEMKGVLVCASRGLITSVMVEPFMNWLVPVSYTHLLVSTPLLVPMGAPRGMTAAAPASWRRLASTGSALM